MTAHTNLKYENADRFQNHITSLPWYNQDHQVVRAIYVKQDLYKYRLIKILRFNVLIEVHSLFAMCLDSMYSAKS